MTSKILVAGGGHGGIAVAAQLAQRGFDVTVYERHKREEMGYDWTDTFSKKALETVGIPMPDESKYTLKGNMTFYGPSENTPIYQHIPEEDFELQMERRDIYDMLISHAEKCGVKFVYECAVNGPLLAGDRAIGIDTSKGKFYGDLVIDACGCESPVRANMPDCCGLTKHAGPYEKFYAYRAFYNRGTDDDYEDKYRVYLSHGYCPSFSWVGCEDDHTDLLIGRFDPFGMDEVNEIAECFRKTNPRLGEKVIRGGQFVEIPVRQTAPVIVADGYAAIGDSAFMTIPLIGSGIANSLNASKILTDTIVGDYTRTYSAETLWPYQVNYFKNIGTDLTPLAHVKLMFTKLTEEQLDYVLDSKILTWRELSLTSESTGISSILTWSPDVPDRIKSIVKNKEVRDLLLKMVADIVKTMAVSGEMPKHYSRDAVQKWARKYEGCFKR